VRLQEERLELFQMQQAEENRFLCGWEDSAPGCDEEAVEAGRYRDVWNPKRGTYEDTSKHTVCISLIQMSPFVGSRLLVFDVFHGFFDWCTDVSSDLLNYNVDDCLD
jgi:hypothetical protein